MVASKREINPDSVTVPYSAAARLPDHDRGLRMSLTVQHRDDNPLWEAGSLRSVYCLGDGAIQIDQSLVDVLAHRQRVAQSGDFVHLQNLAPRFGAFENVARITYPGARHHLVPCHSAGNARSSASGIARPSPAASK